MHNAPTANRGFCNRSQSNMLNWGHLMSLRARQLRVSRSPEQGEGVAISLLRNLRLLLPKGLAMTQNAGFIPVNGYRFSAVISALRIEKRPWRQQYGQILTGL